MSDEGAAGTATAPSGDAPQQDSGQPQGLIDGQQPLPGTPEGPQGTDGGDLSPEEMLAGAMESGDGDSGDDPAKRVADLEKQIASLKKHSRTWEGRAKENSAAAAKLRELEDAQKTELQRATEGLTTARQEAVKWESLYHRTMACAKYDLDLDLMDQIQGTTEEEIDASAERMARIINERASVLAAAQQKAGGNGAPQQYQQQGGHYRPVESLRPGALPASENRPFTPEEWLRGQIKR